LRQILFLLPVVLTSSVLAILGGCVDRSDVGAFGADAGQTTIDGGEGPSAEAEAGAVTIDVAPATTRIAAGGQSTCAIDAKGAAKCWGDNRHGSLGIGGFSPEMSEAAVAVSGLSSGVRAVAGGASAHCALLVNGGARCWGTSLFGEIAGTGSFDSVDMPQPHDKTGLSNDIAQVAFGTSFACALTTKGRAKCWGRGGAGQLGTGSTNDEFAARDVAGIDEPVARITASMGGMFACAVTASGKVLCWGENGERQLGTATPKNALPSPVVGLDREVTAVAAGRSHACALYKDGGVACWGGNAKAQLGIGKTGGPNPPQRVTGVGSATKLVAGGDHTCAIVADGGTLCWGSNLANEVGPAAGPLGPTVSFPASFKALDVALGFNHTCVINAQAMVSCLGDDSRNQTGQSAFSL
jgi:alpha-tubulin suppressor-like RCC1 family protein